MQIKFNDLTEFQLNKPSSITILEKKYVELMGHQRQEP